MSDCWGLTPDMAVLWVCAQHIANLQPNAGMLITLHGTTDFLAESL
ncbi:hypothetical protein [Ruegeria sp. HKCCA6837]|nr:hypothetical protein [Ruegeria sp. HKCCA6837]